MRSYIYTIILLFSSSLLFSQNLLIKKHETEIKGDASCSITSRADEFIVYYESDNDTSGFQLYAAIDTRLPADFKLSFSVNSPQNLSFRVFIKDSSGLLYKGSKYFEHTKSKKPAAYTISRSSFRRAGDNSYSYPSYISELIFVCMLPKESDGSIEVTKLAIEERYQDYRRVKMPVAKTSKGIDIADKLFDADSTTFQQFGKGKSTLDVDFHMPYRSGGMFLIMDSLPSSLDIFVYNGTKENKKNLLAKTTVQGRSKVYIPIAVHETARYLIVFNSKTRLTLKELSLLPENFTDENDIMFAEMQKQYQPGLFPAGYTLSPLAARHIPGAEVFGASLDMHGTAEFPKLNFSILPFLRIYDEFGIPALAKQELRFSPDTSSAVRSNLAYTYGEVWIHTFADSFKEEGFVNLLYEIRNTYHFKIKGKLHLAVVPMKQNPFNPDEPAIDAPFKLTELQFKDEKLLINRKQEIVLLTEPQAAGLYSLNTGDTFEAALAENPNGMKQIKSPGGTASALISYDFTLIPGARRLISLTLPVKVVTKLKFSRDDQNLEPRLKKLRPIE